MTLYHPQHYYRFFCNNIGIITNILSLQASEFPCPNDTTNDDCDLFMAIDAVIHICKPLELQFLHVKGHQDTKAHCPLTIMENTMWNATAWQNSMWVLPPYSAHHWTTWKSRQPNPTSASMVKKSANVSSWPSVRMWPCQPMATTSAQNLIGPQLMPSKSIGTPSTMQSGPSYPMINAKLCCLLMTNCHYALPSHIHTLDHSSAHCANKNPKTFGVFLNVIISNGNASLRICTIISQKFHPHIPSTPASSLQFDWVS